MPEQNFGGPNWELVKGKLENVNLRARFAAEGAVQGIRYKAQVSAEIHQRALLMAEVFAGEAMDYLSDNPSAKLKAVQPTEAQLSVFYYLFNTIDRGSLILNSTNGRVQDGTDRPSLVHVYEAGETPEQQGGSLAYDLSDLLGGKHVTLITRWEVSEEFPLGFSVFGSIGQRRASTIDFFILPGKAKNSSQIEVTINRGRKDEKTKVSIYNNGERIIFNREGVYQGEDFAITKQYYLVGAFDGEGIGKTYWLYGSNEEKHSKMNVRPRVEAREFATQLVGNK